MRRTDGTGVAGEAYNNTKDKEREKRCLNGGDRTGAMMIGRRRRRRRYNGAVAAAAAATV